MGLPHLNLFPPPPPPIAVDTVGPTTTFMSPLARVGPAATPTVFTASRGATLQLAMPGELTPVDFLATVRVPWRHNAVVQLVLASAALVCCLCVCHAVQWPDEPLRASATTQADPSTGVGSLYRGDWPLGSTRVFVQGRDSTNRRDATGATCVVVVDQVCTNGICVCVAVPPLRSGPCPRRCRRPCCDWCAWCTSASLWHRCTLSQVAPSCAIIVPNSTLSYSSTPTLIPLRVDAEDTSPVHVLVYVDNAFVMSAVSATTVHLPTLSEGPHVVKAVAMDAANNTQVGRAWVWSLCWPPVPAYLLRHPRAALHLYILPSSTRVVLAQLEDAWF